MTIEEVFNPCNEPVKQAELTDVDQHWENLWQNPTSEILKSNADRYDTDTAPTCFFSETEN